MKTLTEIEAFFADPAFREGYTHLNGEHLPRAQIESWLKTESEAYLNALIDTIGFETNQRSLGRRNLEPETYPVSMPLNRDAIPTSTK